MLYRSILRRLLFQLPPETAHEVALKVLRTAPSLPKLFAAKASNIPIERFGLNFRNPIGLAAGFDKDGIALEGLGALGFGFIEAGTVTFHPQPGNERPRLFRLPADHALINRAGFNNQGAAAFAAHVAKTTQSRDYVLGVSIGKSKIAPLAEAIDDYTRSFELVHPVADYIAVNVSSPNTPGLRDLQQAAQLEALLVALQDRNASISKQNGAKPKPVLIKLSPDLEASELEKIVTVAQRTAVAGIIATNTTITRNGLQTPKDRITQFGTGGLSGQPLRLKSSRMVAELFRLTSGALPLIGVGGIFTAEDAWEKICAGASLVQLYTGFIYQGPGIVSEISEGLVEIMRREGFKTIDEAVGCRASELALT